MYKRQAKYEAQRAVISRVIFGGNLLNTHAIQLENPCASYTYIVGCAGCDRDRLRQYFSQECRHPWRETVERMGNGQKDDTYKSLVMRFNIFTLQIQISLSTEYICTSHILCFIIQCC